MRKVTASAVLLTAMTGCAHSKAPTTQWSFEVPNSNETASLTNLDRDLALPLSLSDDAQAFVDQASQRLAAPTFEPKPFEQSGVASSKPPAVVSLPNISAPSTAPNSAPRAANEGAVTAATPLADELIETYTASRPDPVAEARAYLSRNSPALVANRAPHSSTEAYLPSFSTATPISDLTPVAPALVASGVASPALPTPNLVSRSLETSVPADNLPSLLPQPLAFEADSLEADTLAIASASVRDVAIAEDVPLGTAILMTMQQGAAENFPEVSTESTTEKFSTTLPSTNLAQRTHLAQLIETDGEAASSADLVATIPTEALTRLPLEEVDPLAALNQTPIGLMPEQTLSSQPTLDSLMRSMPARDSSPLVEQFQVAETPPLDQSDFAQVEARVESNTQVESTLESALPILDSPYALSEESGLLDLSSNTIYLPIADEVVDMPTSSLASSIRGVISTLGHEASIATFIHSVNIDSAESASAESTSTESTSTEPTGVERLSDELSDELPSEQTEDTLGLARSISTQTNGNPHPLSAHHHFGKHADTTTQKPIPAFDVDRLMTDKIVKTSRALNLHPNAARRLKETAQRAIPVFQVDKNLSSRHRHRTFWQ